jgi:hypothetical protein
MWAKEIITGRIVRLLHYMWSGSQCHDALPRCLRDLHDILVPQRDSPRGSGFPREPPQRCPGDAGFNGETAGAATLYDAERYRSVAV